MALRTPPSWLQQGSHPAENDRLAMQGIIATTGIIGSGSLAVTQNGTPNMSVNVAAGWAAIVGDSTTNMGVYQIYNDAAQNLTITTAPVANSRIDRIVATVNDAYYSGLLNNVTFSVIAGTVAASPTAPATPSNSISLATIAVGTGVTSILTANITDTRSAVTSNLINTASFATLTGTQTLTNKTLTSPVFGGAALEAAFTTGTGFAGYTFDATTNGSIQYSTANATANGTVNIRSTSLVSINTLLAVNQSLTIVLAITNGATPYYPNAWQIDGSAVTPKWSGGTAPTAGNASSIDIYTLNIIKTAATPTYTVLASQTKFA
jgi:hypothetical protein